MIYLLKFYYELFKYLIIKNHFYLILCELENKQKQVIKESNSIIVKSPEQNSNSLSISRQQKSAREAIILKTQNINSPQDEVITGAQKHKSKQLNKSEGVMRIK